MRASLKSVEADSVRIEMIRRGWSNADIAKRAGLKSRSFEAQLSCNFPNVAARHKVEKAFDYWLPIWSSVRTLAARKFCRDKFGADPSLLGLPALRQLAARLPLPGWQAHTKKSDLLAAVLIHLTATNNPDALKLKNPPTSQEI
jgi:hypothetical protein